MGESRRVEKGQSGQRRRGRMVSGMSHWGESSSLSVSGGAVMVMCGRWRGAVLDDGCGGGEDAGDDEGGEEGGGG